MSLEGQRFTTPVTLVVDTILIVLFFLGIYQLVASHVPSNDKSMIMLWGGLTAACMSGVFWLCIQMFRLVLRAQLADRRRK